jgi:predicted nucleotidyltransferase
VASQGPTLARALANATTELTELDIAYALVGGLAVSARAEPRLTRDVDLAIATRGDEDAEGCVAKLIARGYRVSATVEQIKTGRLATVRLVPPGNVSLVVDLLFASCGIEPEIVDQAETLEILPRVHVPVARASHLIAMKLLARDDRDRPQDRDDIHALLATIGAGERKRVNAAIALISKRGFARGRDLGASWKEVAHAISGRGR